MAYTINGPSTTFSVKYYIYTDNDKSWQIENNQCLGFTNISNGVFSSASTINGTGDTIFRIDIGENISTSPKEYYVTTKLTDSNCVGINKQTTIIQSGKS